MPSIRARVIKVGLKFFLKHFFATICASSGLWSLSARVICSSPITIRCAHTSHRRANASCGAFVVVSFSSFVAFVSPSFFALDGRPRASRRRLRYRDKERCVSTPRHATRPPPPPPRTTGFIFLCARDLWHHQFQSRKSSLSFWKRELEASKMPSKKSALLCIHTKGEKKKKKKKTCRAAPREARCVPDGAITTHRYHPLRAVVLPTQEERRRRRRLNRRPQTGVVKWSKRRR